MPAWIWNKVHLLPPYRHAWSIIPISLPNYWLQKMKGSHILGKERGSAKVVWTQGSPEVARDALGYHRKGQGLKT